MDISTLGLCTFNYFRYEIAAVSGTYASAEHTIRITFMQQSQFDLCGTEMQIGNGSVSQKVSLCMTAAL